jgi:hypothetical protein
MAYRHLPSPDFHRLDCQHYGLREDEHKHEHEDEPLVAATPRQDQCRLTRNLRAASFIA